MLFFIKKKSGKNKINMKLFIKKHSNMIASLEMAFSFFAANSRCVCIFHQPEMLNDLISLPKQ